MVRRPLLLALCGLLAASFVADSLHAVAAPREDKVLRGSLADKMFASGRTTFAPDNEAIGTARPFMEKAAGGRWEAFRQARTGDWSADVDKRTGKVNYVEGAGIPWIPGRGNTLGAGELKALSPNGTVDLAVMERAARAFLPEVADMLGVDPSELVLNQGASAHPAGHVWFVDFDVVRDGMKVEGAHVVFRVNNGNLVQFGSENLPPAGARAPRASVAKAAARQALGDLIGGFLPGDRWVDKGSLHLMPANVVDESEAEGYRPGQGRGLQLLWEFTFKRAGEPGTWRGRVDAQSGEVVEFLDVNHYGTATGGTYKSDRPAAEVVMPLPWANVATGVFANSAGIFSGTTGTTTLNGQFVAITDTCGSISKAADGSGTIAMGSSTGTDCTTPGSGGAGNTHAARTQFYMVNRGKEAARGWLPSNSWLNAKVTAKVNLNQTCNAYWDGSSLNFFKSGGGCANTGELPGVSLHEWGHGMDTNDGNGDPPDNGTGETYGDVSAMLAIHSSCTGNGFLPSNCSGYGNACNSCSGVREADWAKKARNAPSTANNFIRTDCPAPTRFPTYVGPCGADAIARGQGTTLRREGHCESLVSTEAVWDLANRDLPSPGSGSAWATLDRLWYLSRSTATAAFTCNVSGGTRTSGSYVSSGCNTGSMFRVFRAVDDDNGNLADGTPHGGAIAAAMDRHAIACTTDAGWNTTFRAVTPPAAPSLSITPGSNSAALSWSGSTGVYDVYRNETGCSAGFTKVANDLAATSFNDTNVANGLTYFYQVTAQPSGNEAAASSPSTCTSVTPTGTGCTPPAAPTGLSASAVSQTQINLSWTASAGATSYTILRSTTSGGPYTTVGTSPTASFSDTSLTCGTTYFYVVQASNGTCSSGNSAQASATTTACACTPPPVPTGVSASAASASQINVSWSASAGATSYNILRSTTSGGPYSSVGTSPTTSFSNTGLACNTTYFYVVQASNGSCASANSAQGSATTSACTGNVLSNGVPVSGISGATGNDQFWTMSVPAGATNLRFTTGSGSGDVDLYVRFGSPPTTTVNDCKSEGSATTESCTIAAPSAGTYHVLLHAFATYSGVTLTGSFTPPGTGGSELITNGGFEGSAASWTLSGTAVWSNGSFPHSGTGYTLMGSATTSSGAEFQQITIPSTATGTMTFWLNVTSSETTTTTAFDQEFVEVRSTAGALLATLATYSNLNKGTAGVYSQKTFDVSAFKGQTVRIQFRNTSDSSLLTTFRIDDVSVK